MHFSCVEKLKKKKKKKKEKKKVGWWRTKEGIWIVYTEYCYTNKFWWVTYVYQILRKD